jgi:hypothetical protein
MAWSVDAAAQVQNLITAIKARLEASGWTLTDRDADGVWNSTNNQGVTQYIQITNVGTYQYLQFQGWQSWSTGTHAGTNGSGTTYNRLYYAPAAVGATTPVDLYMSVTANRFVIVIQAPTNYRNWAYFGGLDALAGTNDPGCAFLVTSFGFNYITGVILASPLTATPWASMSAMIPAVVFISNTGNEASALSFSALGGQGPIATPGKITLWPIMLADGSNSIDLRGNMDGVQFCPIGSGAVGHMDTVVIGGITWLIIVPGGVGTGATGTGHSITGNYGQALAIAEV